MPRRPPVLLLLVPFACTAPEEEHSGFRDGVTFTSEHFRYYARRIDPDVCPRTIDAVEEHLAAVGPALGIGWPRGHVVEYFKFLDYDDLTRTAICGAHRACEVGPFVFSPYLVHGHELVHAYAHTVGRPPSLFVEGLATVLSCDYGRWSDGDLAKLRAIRWEHLALWRGDTWQYAGSAQLSRFLIDSFGIQSLMTFYALTPAYIYVNPIAQAFEAHFGMTLETAWSEALALDHPGGICMTPQACGAPALPLDRTPVEFDQPCGTDEEFRSMMLPSDGTLGLAMTGDGIAVLGSCDGVNAMPDVPLHAAPGLTAGWSVRLPAGRYYVRQFRRIGTSFRLTAAFEPSGGISPDCEKAVSVPVDAVAAPPVLDLHVPGGSPSGTAYVGVDYPVATRVSVSASYVAGDEPYLYMCRTCGQPLDQCSAPITPSGLTGTVEGRYVLVVPTPGPAGTFRTVRLTRK